MSKPTLLIICVFISFYSCKKEELDTISVAKPEVRKNYKVNEDGEIILGRKLENPYSMENMNRAYKNIISNYNIKTDRAPVRVTHYYVRFLPKNSEEYDLLKSDTALKLYSMPLDYEIKVDGWNYHDPAISSDSPTWQYTSVSKNYKFFPGVKYEILSELYLPESDNSILLNFSNVKIGGKEFVDALVDEAMILTKNFDDTLKGSNISFKGKWFPSGKVNVYDTQLKKYIPLVGVKMRARRWFDIKETYTNKNGLYLIPSFDRPVNYALFFETTQFDVRSGTWGQAWINGPKQTGSWNVDIYDLENRFYAHVFRGAWRYHYGNIAGLKRPKVWGRLKYCAYNKKNNGDLGDDLGNFDFTGVIPDIRIWRIAKNGERESDEIFSTTVHETAHASHIELMKVGEIQFGQVSNKIVESWAVAVQWMLTSMEYRERGIPDYGKPFYNNTKIDKLLYGYQYWTLKDDTEYTSLFIDLVDDYNQHGAFVPSIFDDISGYSLSGIESGFLKKTYGLSSLKDNLKRSKPLGVTDSKIDNFISNF